MTMARIPRRNVVSVLLLLILSAASVVYAIWPREEVRTGGHAERIPVVLGEWRGTKYEFDARTIELLGTDDILARGYVRGKEPVVDFVIIFATHTRRATHPPEQCLKGEGWLIEDLVKTEVPAELLPPRLKGRGFGAMELVIRKPDRRKLVLYFYKSGKRYTHSYYKEQLNVAFGRFGNPNVSDGLIRLITSIGPEGIEGARTRLHEFRSLSLPEIENLP